MDLTETMKAVLSKTPVGSGGGNNPGIVNSGGNSSHGSQTGDQPPPGTGYVTEKLYMLLQLYLQNKGWNPSVELLQCFSELKDSALLPNAAYLQVLANRLALDSQGRLVLRESGKIVLPFEHFANAVMLKHMSGPHGLHLSLEATVRAVMESYTIGRENFGMEKEFIIEVVQSCPNPACRYYKNHLGVGFMDQQFQGAPLNPEFMAHLPQMGSSNVDMVSAIDATKSSQNNSGSGSGGGGGASAGVGIGTMNQNSNQMKHLKTAQSVQQQQQQQQQQQITAAIIQQQNRAIAHQSLEKFGNLSPMEKQRVLQQLDKKHYEAAQQVVNMVSPSNNNAMGAPSAETARILKKRNIISTSTDNKFVGMIPSNGNTTSGVSVNPQQVMNLANQQVQQQQQQHQQQQQQQQQQLLPPPPQIGQVSMDQQTHKPNEFYKTNLDCLESLTSNKDLLALHNGAWGNQDGRDGMIAGQDKIVRAFAELMRNMARMKTFIRPSMCKPYGKQSESLQKTLVDTIQLVQSLRGCLPAPHIPVSSWKSEDRHRKDPDLGNYES